MKFLERLKGRKGVEDFEAALNENEREAAAARARLAQIDGQRESVLMEAGETALAKLDTEAAELRRKIEVLDLAAKAIAKRLEAAEAERQNAEDEKLVREAQASIADPLTAALRAYHASAMNLVESVQRIEQLETRLREINQRLASRGRHDLQLATPYGKASALLREFAKQNGYARLMSEKLEEKAKNEGINAVPDEGWSGLPWPVAAPSLRMLTIPGYAEAGRLPWEQPYRFI